MGYLIVNAVMYGTPLAVVFAVAFVIAKAVSNNRS